MKEQNFSNGAKRPGIACMQAAHNFKKSRGLYMEFMEGWYLTVWKLNFYWIKEIKFDKINILFDEKT